MPEDRRWTSTRTREKAVLGSEGDLGRHGANPATGEAWPGGLTPPTETSIDPPLLLFTGLLTIIPRHNLRVARSYMDRLGRSQSQSSSRGTQERTRQPTPWRTRR